MAPKRLRVDPRPKYDSAPCFGECADADRALRFPRSKGSRFIVSEMTMNGWPGPKYLLLANLPPGIFVLIGSTTMVAARELQLRLKLEHEPGWLARDLQNCRFCVTTFSSQSSGTCLNAARLRISEGCRTLLVPLELETATFSEALKKCTCLGNIRLGRPVNKQNSQCEPSPSSTHDYENYFESTSMAAGHW